MAKRKTKAKKKATGPKGNGNDPTIFALIHWFAVAIEKLAIETYVTDADSAGALTKVLRASLADLGHVKVNAVIDDECPDPWIWCENRQRCCGECGTEEGHPHHKDPVDE